MTHRLPTLFVSHGAPTLALDPGSTGPGLAAFARSLPRPEAVLVVSAHWMTQVPAVSAAERPETIHDFFGFPQALYALRYDAPGAPALARRVAALLGEAGLSASEDASRGLDHGAWVPLRFLFPEADVPVTQLSIQLPAGAPHHYALGRALSRLPGEGVLVVGSGGLTHNLSEFGRWPPDAAPAPYVSGFRTWIGERVAAGAVEDLIDYRRLAPNAARAHPTEDHFLPFFVPLGAAGDRFAARRVVDEVSFGMLAMDAYAFEPV